MIEVQQGEEQLKNIFRIAGLTLLGLISHSPLVAGSIWLLRSNSRDPAPWEFLGLLWLPGLALLGGVCLTLFFWWHFLAYLKNKVRPDKQTKTAVKTPVT